MYIYRYPSHTHPLWIIDFILHISFSFLRTMDFILSFECIRILSIRCLSIRKHVKLFFFFCLRQSTSVLFSHPSTQTHPHFGVFIFSTAAKNLISNSAILHCSACRSEMLCTATVWVRAREITFGTP